MSPPTARLSKSSASVRAVGAPLPRERALPHFDYIRNHGIQQFISQYRSHEGIENDELKWGDEMEYAILKMDHANKMVRISTRASDVMKDLQTREDQQPLDGPRGCTWMPEYGSWMVEGIPKVPYGGLTSHLTQVEENMRLRRKRLLAALADDEIAPTMTNFPLFGVGLFTSPPAEPAGPKLQSDYVPDSVINPHPRFAAATEYIRERRERQIDAKIPLYEDLCTPEFRLEPEVAEERAPPSITMDTTAFGSGCCCLQVTCQARDVEESRYMFDQLAVLSPIMLALSAATPIHKGRLADTDVRWDTISSCADDRTLEEMGSQHEPIARDLYSRRACSDEAGGGNVAAMRQPKSRYGSISTFIYNCCRSDRCRVMDNYNDIDCPVDDSSYRVLLGQGLDPVLSKHMAHLFTRDPLVVFEGRIEEVDDDTELDHFDSIQSTIWQSVRWKPPPPRVNPNDPHIGWRTELRTLEIQLTDFENAAYAVFVILVTRATLAFGLNFYIPISKVDDNMRRAHERDAATKGKFFFRNNIGFARPPSQEGCFPGNTYRPCADEPQNGHEEMTILAILEGKGEFIGLLPVVHAYLEYVNADRSTVDDVDRYLHHLRKRAAGEVMTTAAWLRHFVRSHPDYRMDSVVTDKIAYDLVVACQEIGMGKRACPELLGDRTIHELSRDELWDVGLASSKTEA